MVFDVEPFSTIYREHKENMSRWCAELRARGVSGAMPDDGWVDRDRDELRFVYPYFLYNAGVGSLIALGDWARYRVVRITERRQSFIAGPVYVFETVEWHPNATEASAK